MFVSYNWLQEYVDIKNTSAKDLAELITRSGIEVEGVGVLNKGITGVVVGHVLACDKHSEADKLSKCLVDIGEDESVQIICGATNVAQGQKVAVAKVGAVLPHNFKIKKAKLRGEVSMGMICSLDELGVDTKLVAKEFADGIFVFPSNVEVGADALEYLNLHDEVLELSITPNRADALNMIGVAYEVAAILGTEVKLPKINKNHFSKEEKTADYISVKIEATEENPKYIAKIVKNVKVGPSPLWIQTRLMAAGVRPINNIVDISNYVLMEYGQPLHTFDYDKLGSKEIVVRLAKEGETILTLDGAERTLQPNQLVITNGDVPVAIAGVIGGENSEVDEGTKNVLIESAVFNPIAIRTTSRQLAIRSEASTRFEKGIDQERTLTAAERAAFLMEQYASGEVVGGVVEVNHLHKEETIVTVSAQQINEILGMAVATEQIADIFTRLGFPYEKTDEMFTVTIPSRRPDIAIPEDLAEEVGRIYGYDNIVSRPMNRKHSQGTLTTYQRKRRKVRRYLEGVGLYEAKTYSLTSPEKAKRFSMYDVANPAVRLAMPMSEERSQLRLSLVPHLLDSVSYNVARKMGDVALYEISSIFLPNEEGELPTEVAHLAVAMTGLFLQHQWQGEKKVVDFFLLKGIVEGLADVLGLKNRIAFVATKCKDMHTGRTANILLDGVVIGYLGQVHPETEKEQGLKATYVFELSLQALLMAEVEEVTYKAVPRFPAITRDMALVVDKSVNAGDVQLAMMKVGGSLLKEVSIFDVYVGEKVAENKKSIAFSLRYFDPERTLTDEEVTKAYNTVLEAMEQAFGASLRG